jgi:hypothetical protein
VVYFTNYTFVSTTTNKLYIHNYENYE